MEITISLEAFNNFLALPPDQMLLTMIWTIGWIPISITFLWGFWQIWIEYIQNQYGAKQKYIFLAIDIPRNNEQSPRAVENLFSYLAGAHASINLIEKYWEGKTQLCFSLEIVSIGGYTQFLIRTPDSLRDLVESAVYSQYPDAEITEVEDYTTDIPSVYPNDEYEMWGAEYIQNNNPAYPIRTYEDFEHIFGPPEKNFRDPMASLMDLCSSLMEGEQMWYQIILRPIGFDWITIGEKEIAKVIGEKVKSKENIFEKLFNGFLNLIGDATGIFILPQAPAVEEKQTFNMMGLKPVQKKQIEAIQDKVSKLGFEAKIRMVYVAKKEVINTKKVVNGFVGFMKQFAYNDLNNIKPDMKHTATKTEYLFKESRLRQKKLSIMTKYKKRSTLGWALKGKVYNVQELATIWHFPIESVVRAPLIQKAPGRKAEPPIALPMAEEVIRPDEEVESIFKRVEDIRRAPADLGHPPEVDSIFEIEAAGDTAAPPENLPFV